MLAVELMHCLGQWNACIAHVHVHVHVWAWNPHSVMTACLPIYMHAETLGTLKLLPFFWKPNMALMKLSRTHNNAVTVLHSVLYQYAI